MERESAEEGEINDDDDDLECLGVFQKPPPNVLAEVFLDSSSDEGEGDAEEIQSPPEKKVKVSSEDSTKLKELIKTKAEIEKQLGKMSDQKDGQSTSTSGSAGGGSNSSVERRRNSSASSTSTASASASYKKLEERLKKIDLKINKLKCREFLLLILRKATDQRKQNRRIMLELIQNLIDGSIQPLQFTNRLDEFKFKATPMLTEFLEKNLQELRNDMIDGSFTINGIQAPLFSNPDIIQRTTTNYTTTTINTSKPIAIVKHHNKSTNHDSSLDNSNISTSTSTPTHNHNNSNNHNNLSASSTTHTPTPTSLLPSTSTRPTLNIPTSSSIYLPTTNTTINTPNNPNTHKEHETAPNVNVNRSSSSSSHNHSHHNHEKSNKNTPNKSSLETRISQDANMTPETSTPQTPNSNSKKNYVSLERIKEYRRVERSIGSCEGEIKTLTEEDQILTKRKEYIVKRLEYLKNKVKSKKQELKDI